MQADPTETLTPFTGHACPQECWSCKGPVALEDLFCPTCSTIQPLGQVDHFKRLDLEATFDLDGNDLDRRYFELQGKLHPDRFATKTSQERTLSMQQATSLNDAYETLKDSLKRADYLVHMMGQNVLPEGCQLISAPDLLEEAMELREALAMAETADDIDAIAARAAGDIDDCEIGLSKAFAGEDIEGACALTTRLKYLRKLTDEVRQQRAKMTAMS